MPSGMMRRPSRQDIRCKKMHRWNRDRNHSRGARRGRCCLRRLAAGAFSPARHADIRHRQALAAASTGNVRGNGTRPCRHYPTT